MLRTCRKTDKPPMPSKNDARIILIETAFIWILEIKEIPFVISIIPVSRGAINSVGIFKNLKHGIQKIFNIFIKWLALNIEIITENITTNPPIIITV